MKGPAHRVAVAMLVCFALAGGCRPIGLRVTPIASDDPVTRALAFFRSNLRRTLTADLAILRPPPATRDRVRRAVLSLPLDGSLDPTPKEAVQLDALRPVLRFHDRDGVLVIQVIDVPQAWIGLHDRAVLLVSRRALALLDVPELQAIAAHEIGHEFFWFEYEHARRIGDVPTTHELELRCDGIAILTLHGLRLDPAVLAVALEKLTRHNETLGRTNNTFYPSLQDRTRFFRGLMSLERLS